MRPPKEVKRELVMQWLAKAETDLGAAKLLIEQETLFLFPVCFHAQQAAEKYIKALLVWRQIEFPKTHDIDELLDILTPVENVLAESLRDAANLTDYGVDIRYPGDVPEPGREDATVAVALAEKVRAAVRAALGDDI